MSQSHRRLCSYKGVTYNRLLWWTTDGMPYETASALIAGNPHIFTDQDHPALMDLKENPFEDLGTLEDSIIRGKDRWWKEDPMADVVHFIAEEVRAWMGQEAQNQSSFGDCRCGITSTGHVNALVAMGAKIAHYKTDERESSGAVLYFTVPSDATHRVLILPPEVSP